MKHQIILTALLATSALATFAQDTDTGAPAGGRPHRGPGGPGGPGHRPPPLVAALDVNKDGLIDATELANASAVLAKLDKNGDGQLTLDELRPPRPADAPLPPADAPKRPLPPMLEALDADHDGVISAAELANASTVLAKLDKNGDGILTPDEFMGGGPRGEGRGPRGPGGPGRGPRPGAAPQPE